MIFKELTIVPNPNSLSLVREGRGSRNLGLGVLSSHIQSSQCLQTTANEVAGSAEGERNVVSDIFPIMVKKKNQHG